MTPKTMAQVQADGDEQVRRMLERSGYVGKVVAPGRIVAEPVYQPPVYQPPGSNIGQLLDPLTTVIPAPAAPPPSISPNYSAPSAAAPIENENDTSSERRVESKDGGGDGRKARRSGPDEWDIFGNWRKKEASKKARRKKTRRGKK
jgi:hypothetical protein